MNDTTKSRSVEEVISIICNRRKHARACELQGWAVDTQAEASAAAAVGGLVDTLRSKGDQPTADDGGIDGPPLVIRGANKKWDSVEVGVDWFRAVGKYKYDTMEAVALLEKLFGSPQPGKGLHFYEASYRFSNGAMVLYDVEGDKGHLVDLPGDVFDGLGQDKAFDLCRTLHLGRHCTRIDLRLDFKSAGGVGLIESVKRSCVADELCRARVWEPKDKYSGTQRVAHGVNLGKRGKDGSGRYVRVYDKGLETEEAAEGAWERWEAEFTGDVAGEVARHVMQADNWQRVAVDYAFGAVDFRVANGSTALNRRERVAWWSCLLAGVNPVTAVRQRVKTSLERWQGWMERCVMPTVQAMSAASGDGVQRILHRLGLDEVKPCPDGAVRPQVVDYMRWRDGVAGA